MHMNNEMTVKATKSSLDELLTIPQSLLNQLSRYYGSVLERPVSNRQTLLLLNAQAAAFMAIFPTACPTLLRIGCIAWFVSALLKCRQAFQNMR